MNERLDAWLLERRGRRASRSLTAIVAGAVLLISMVLASFGITALVAKGYGTVAWGYLVIYMIPLLTVGVYKIWRIPVRLVRPPFCCSALLHGGSDRLHDLVRFLLGQGGRRRGSAGTFQRAGIFAVADHAVLRRSRPTMRIPTPSASGLGMPVLDQLDARRSCPPRVFRPRQE